MCAETVLLDAEGHGGASADADEPDRGVRRSTSPSAASADAAGGKARRGGGAAHATLHLHLRKGMECAASGRGRARRGGRAARAQHGAGSSRELIAAGFERGGEDALRVLKERGAGGSGGGGAAWPTRARREDLRHDVASRADRVLASVREDGTTPAAGRPARSRPRRAARRRHDEDAPLWVARRAAAAALAALATADDSYRDAIAADAGPARRDVRGHAAARPSRYHGRVRAARVTVATTVERSAAAPSVTAALVGGGAPRAVRALVTRRARLGVAVAAWSARSKRQPAPRRAGEWPCSP